MGVDARQDWGQARREIKLVEGLLRGPSSLTIPQLRFDPVWDPLRGDLRFEALLNDPTNNAPLF
jgi:hypothetical protein